METQVTPEVKASSLPSNQQVPYTSPTQTAHYAKKNLKGNNEVTYLSSRKPVLEGLSNPHPEEDTLEHIMDKAVELDMLYIVKEILKES